MAGIIPTITVVSVTGTSATLATLLGAAISSSTKQITLRPHNAGIFMAVGTASAATDPLGTSPIVIDGGLSELATLEFYAASATGMTVIQEG